MRVKAIIAYNGTLFQGFQKQKTTRNTIVSAIENALCSLGITSPVTGSGRTDAGVHATGQVIHIDLPDYWSDLQKLKQHLNAKLHAIEFKHITAVDQAFHARFSAKKRLYRYIIKSTKPTVFERDFVASLPLQDLSKLEEALACFVGSHDFGYFHKTGSDTRDHTREIYRAYHKQRGHYHAIYFEANGFLRAQVRMMIDFAVKVSNGELTITQLKEQLSLQTIHGRKLAPPQGLYLARIRYPKPCIRDH